MKGDGCRLAADSNDACAAKGWEGKLTMAGREWGYEGEDSADLC